MKKEIFKITFIAEISLQRLNDILIGAFEGGSNYWIENIKRSNDDLKYYADFLTSDKGFLIIQENDRNEGKYKVAKNDVILAAQLMALQYPWHFKDLLNETDDATTSDVLLQLATFKVVIYG